MANIWNDVSRALEQLDRLDRSVAALLPKATEAGALVLWRATRQRVRRRGGKTYDSIKHEPVSSEKDRATHKVFSDHFVARLLEYGTVKMAKKPFWRPAIDQTTSEIDTVMAQYILDNDGL